jgi:hypothetical protein
MELTLFIILGILILAFIVGGIPILLAKKIYTDTQTPAATSAKPGPTSKTITLDDPNSFFISAWGWIVHTPQNADDAELASSCVFNTDSTVNCVFADGNYVFTLDSDAAGVTTIVSGNKITGSSVVPLTREQYLQYSYVNQGNVDTKCKYYYVPPVSDKVLGIPRRQIIINNNNNNPVLSEMQYIPTCMQPNIIDGQRYIRACTGTILFGSRYQALSKCIDAKGIDRPVNYIESYVSSCEPAACDSTTKLVYLSMAPNNDAAPNTNDAEPIYVTLPPDFGIPDLIQASVYTATVKIGFSYLDTTYHGAESQVFEAEFFDANKQKSNTGVNIRLKNQESDAFVLTIAKFSPGGIPAPDNDPGPLVLMMGKQADVFNNGINWRYIDVQVIQNKSVFSGMASSLDPAWTFIDSTKFKTRIEGFHTTLQTQIPNDWFTPLLTNYNNLVSQNKIYLPEQGLIEIITLMRSEFSALQGIVSGGITPSGAVLSPINNMFDAFQALFYMYYNSAKHSSIAQLQDISYFYNLYSSFLGVFSVAMVNEIPGSDLTVKTFIHDHVNSLIPLLDDMNSQHSDQRFVKVRDVLSSIANIPTNTSLTKLEYLKKAVSEIPQNSTTSVPTFSENWVLLRTALVDTGTAFTEDHELYIPCKALIEEYKKEILNLIAGVQGHAEVITYLPGGLTCCGDATSIPLIPTDIINWITENTISNPVYRVYRSDTLSYGIEQLAVIELTYFGLTNLTSDSFIPKSSLDMNAVLGINSKSSGSII